MYHHILISTDGSELGTKGLDHGLTLAKALGAKVTVITVTERFPAYAISAGEVWITAAELEGEFESNQQKLAEGILTAAREAGATQVLARGAFSTRLPSLLLPKDTV